MGPTDSIREFRLSAHCRYHDGFALAAAGQRTGAIYLWGYTAEMLLKAAYFSAIGIQESAVVGWKSDIVPAIEKGRKLGIAWPISGQGHNVRAWSELLVLERGPYYPVAFGLEVQRQGQRFEPLWRETLRYRKNVAYPHEVRQVHEAADWLLDHFGEL